MPQTLNPKTPNPKTLQVNPKTLNPKTVQVRAFVAEKGMDVNTKQIDEHLRRTEVVSPNNFTYWGLLIN